ncbi:arsenate reductase (glutaredoxin) [Zooshikella harenae]|uniref:Arsenate reductase n=1 Tax=Zooshikella harenae TaxID=2827238 RepID=A0ABS5Z8A3_9GAMM|nr:arsenate reductase (glutaredoxin) [Zooshikella harenae]MBU2710276.1 arsenate reductase (glutaredoxin) [Zooshikella harenae]
MSELVIYHNPRCSKSRATLALIEEQGYTPKIVEYLKTPPSLVELHDILKKLGIQPREILRTKEEEYKQLNLADPSLSDEAILTAINEHPRLLERPIVVAKDQAAIGRPPENVLPLLASLT